MCVRVCLCVASEGGGGKPISILSGHDQGEKKSVKLQQSEFEGYHRGDINIIGFYNAASSSLGFGEI